ncbi:hypothetical protein AAVH_25886 [Aphelenchoides avenae]|nr:hypothetical protein AAVH_25886 [Aphelenchus avenae]
MSSVIIVLFALIAVVSATIFVDDAVQDYIQMSDEDTAMAKRSADTIPLCARLNHHVGKLATRETRHLSNLFGLQKRAPIFVDDSLQVPGLALAWYCRHIR